MALIEVSGVCSLPCITKELEDRTVRESKAAKFVCHGTAMSSVCWYKNNELITESRQFTMLEEIIHTSPHTCQYVLVITRSTSDFAGLYACVLTNSYGSVTSSAYLHVQCSFIETDNSDAVALPRQPVVIEKRPVGEEFTLMEILGRGKFGIVHKCVHNDTNSEYAAKVSKCRQRKIVENEIDVLNALNHPLIIGIVAAFEHQRQIVTILELVSGGELFERLMENELISEIDVIFYIEQVLRAIKYMHSQRILHLDLKPENILLVNKQSTQIKIVDFSVSRRMETDSDIKTICGTLNFNAPELINYDPVTAASDIWSIGVIAFILLAGFSPFAGDSEAEISSSILHCAWSCDDPVFEDVSTEAKDFIGTLLQREPEDRATCDEALQHPWLRNVHSPQHSKKKIRTERFVSFVARRNWKKSIAVVQATTSLFRKISGLRMEREKELASSYTIAPVTEQTENDKEDHQTGMNDSTDTQTENDIVDMIELCDEYINPAHHDKTDVSATDNTFSTSIVAAAIAVQDDTETFNNEDKNSTCNVVYLKDSAENELSIEENFKKSDSNELLCDDFSLRTSSDLRTDSDMSNDSELSSELRLQNVTYIAKSSSPFKDTSMRANSVIIEENGEGNDSFTVEPWDEKVKELTVESLDKKKRISGFRDSFSFNNDEHRYSLIIDDQVVTMFSMEDYHHYLDGLQETYI